MYKKIIIICGMPRSGTSWLGQIFDSSPDVAFRMEPLFSYKFKNIINYRSSKEEMVKFFNDIYLSNDDFINQKENRNKGAYSTFYKNENSGVLVVKTTRHHYMLERYLSMINSIEIVSIIRHPCAVISSWISTDREFLGKGCSVDEDWRSGTCRKDGEGEFWGFNDWLLITRYHIELCQKYSNFHIVKYSDLVHRPDGVISELFDSLDIKNSKQTKDFLQKCNITHNSDPYSVFKNTDVESKWKHKLNKAIADEIINDTIAAGLGDFVE
ncbi:MAG TPA: sulfotransferase [Gammaproteobacteria bacterium]|nr:sulfotransferase [Gammaproteobacteria bacterium]